MSENAFRNLSGDVSVGNASKTPFGVDDLRLPTSSFNASGCLASNATAMLPCEARIRAIPAP